MATWDPRANDLFLQALEVGSPAERQAFLDRACAGDAALRADVQSLLGANDRAGGFLESPPQGPLAIVDEPAAEQPGATLGPYKLVEQIGEGGMGTVWMAQQTAPVKRLVALKLIKAGMDTRQVVARFEAERQALAIMDHPNIARVFDGGATPSGRPYFVMELVRGVPVTEYCEQCRLTTRERLDLFLSVCQAVQHAHQKGVIHRDLKPSNVLVAVADGQPRVKVIDFGVAKAINQRLSEHTLQTGFHQLIGTPLYMSPEQAELSPLDVDTRADIYSLGVLLYELLTGTTPFEKERLSQASYDELRRIIREEEPPRPSVRLSTLKDELSTVAAQRRAEPQQLLRAVRGDLDWIVMKALEKDRGRRYETANALAADVQRYLADEPVQACPPSAGYRLRKFVRRNRGPAVAASAILLCLLTGIVGTTAGLVWAVRERDKKAGALVAETRAKDRERQSRDRAVNALREMTDEFIENQMARDAQLTDENKEFLRRIIAHFEGLAAVAADDDESRAIRAEGFYRVGSVHYRLGELTEAEVANVNALALGKQLAADAPTQPEFRRLVASVHNTLGNLRRDLGRLNDAEADFRDALVIRKQLAGEYPDEPMFRRDLAASQLNLGTVFHARGRPKEAEPFFAEALALYKQLAGEFPTRSEFRRELAACHHNLGAVFQATGRPNDAKTSYRDALAIRAKLAGDFPNRAELRHDQARSHFNMGTLFQATSRPKEAESAYAEALTLLKQLARESPNRPDLRQDLARSHFNLGAVLQAMNRVKEAEVAYADAIGYLVTLAADGPNPAEWNYILASTYGNLAVLRIGQNDFKGARDHVEKAVPYQEAAIKANSAHPNYRQSCRSTLSILITVGACLGDTAGVKQAAEKMRDLGFDAPGDAYAAARLLSRCILIVREHHKGTEKERDTQVASYGDAAVAMLRDAVARGYRDAAQMEKDGALAPLRERADFKKLLTELKAK